MRWYYKFLIGIIIIAIIGGLAYREKLIRQYPSYVRHYQKIMKKVSSEEYITKLLEKYPELNYIYMDKRGKNSRSFVWLLDWLHERLSYTKEKIERHEDPIEIIEYGLGRCGEFSIAYTAICLACDWKARIILDMTDHMWTEINLGSSLWLHIDPTQQRINDPYMYERDWKKDLTEVWGIEADYCERIEEKYQWEG